MMIISAVSTLIELNLLTTVGCVVTLSARITLPILYSMFEFSAF